ncbi:hypothetical protein [Sphingomonas aracearum]|uniref:Uncharacterized protein n=1 Tax=Sphingomonas aracearum TaxID=2283317 RepID=A0A369W559_9SPHN|nr:hypothetical protein [Sphingomonas aracearum]RDE07211.1 hypothetical protein DVW87_06125 [Sphingomonas aracearum]
MRSAGKAMACLLALAGIGAQDVPAGKLPRQDEDIVVSGEVTRIEPGLWTLERRPTRVVVTPISPPAARSFSTCPGSEAKLCVADDALPDAVRPLLGAGKDRPPQPGCSRMKIEVGQAPVAGRRIGACAGQAVPVKPAPIASPAPRLVPAAPVTTPPPRPTLVRSEDDHDYEVARRPPPPPVAGEAEDVVVVARKLRRMRLHYSSDGKIMRFCHADISSGDPRIDRIGCAMLRLCVREGYDDKPSALACLNRRIDFVDAPERGGAPPAAPPPRR